MVRSATAPAAFERTLTFRSPAARMVASAGRAWRPRERPDPVRWCEDNLNFPVERSAHGGPFNLDEYPYWRPVFGWATDPEVRRIVLPGATQIGKTSLEFALMAYRAVASPAPAMFGGPDKEFIWDIRDRFYAMCEVSPALMHLIPPPTRRNDRYLDLLHMLVYLAYAGNTQRLSGKACQFVLLDEVDRWRASPREGSTQEKIQQRTSQFWNWLIMFVGSVTDEQSYIWSEYETTDQCTWRCPCPRCGHYQELRYYPHRQGPFAGNGGLAGLKGSDGAWLTPERAQQSAYYRCERGCRIDQIDKPKMIARGVECPKKGTVDKHGRVTAPARARARARGLHINKLYAHKVSFGDAAAALVEAQNDPEKLRVLWNDHLALRWVVQTSAPKWKAFGRRLAGGHPRGTAPQGALFLTCGVDKQGDDCRWVVRAWGDGGVSWLVDWGIEPRQKDPKGKPIDGSDLEALRERIVNRTWPLIAPNVWGQRELRVRHMGVDSGAMKELVRAFVKSFVGDRVLMLRGNTGLRGDLWAAFPDEKDPRGKKDAAGLLRYDVNVDAFKEALHNRWTFGPDQPGRWWLFANPVRDAEQYLREVVNEGIVTHKDKRTKKIKRWWSIVNHRFGNHFFDCEVYNLWLAHLVTGGDFAKVVERFGPAAGRPSGAAATSSREHTEFLAR